MNAADIRAAWLAFKATASAPDMAEPFFTAAVSGAVPAFVPPYVHGDPRVDRWQVAYGANHETATAPPGFEPLAAWSPFGVAEAGTAWERPLRRQPAKEPDR